ncbi:MAG TPA: VOC family protein [Prolixibacteraceae bacterium]|jgi:predicted 3-demethylubiquinone-9 3-methyltransferase (glyoxalase superfamily)
METDIKREPDKNMKETALQKITPFLWFDTQSEEAANLYTSIFKNSRIKTITRYGEEGARVSGREKGSVMTVAFQLEGQEFVALNGGPVYEITPAISFFVNCETEQEIDSLWKKLSEGGTVLMTLNKYPFSEKFGWLKDQFGVTWQLMIGEGMQKITPFLMFGGDQSGKAEEAINFYVSLFSDSAIIHLERYDSSEEVIEGTIKYARFSLNEQEFLAMDTIKEHSFTFTPALSLSVNCESQEEIDHFWDQLSEGGDQRSQQCGWLQDRYGISWQIVPRAMGEMMSDPDPEKSRRVMQAMLQMKKLDIRVLREAYERQ